MNFNEKLMELRKKQGLSQEALGAKINVTRQTVSKWELGETTPELQKLMELSALFNLSIDELVGKEIQQGRNGSFCRSRYEYEYVSKRRIGGIPLLHIHVGTGMKKAKGIIAIGNIAKGVVSIGVCSMGVFSVGAVGVGILSLAGLSMGLLAVGGAAVGVIAAGGFAAGWLAAGGIAVGRYALGGLAVADRIAMGGYAQAQVAIGDVTNGAVNCDIHSCTGGELEQLIVRELPGTPSFIVKLFGLAN